MYLQADKNYILNLETYDFELMTSQSQRVDIDVPLYLWRFDTQRTQVGTIGVDNDGQPVYAGFRKVYELPLNGFSLSFEYSYDYATLKFINRMERVPEKIELRVSPLTFMSNTVGTKFLSNVKERLVGVAYRMKYGGITRAEQIDFGEDVNGTPRFSHVRNLASYKEKDMVVNRLSYGLRPTKFDIIYKGRSMGKNLAIICGVWAVLLTDKLEFDSVCLLNGVKETKLGVEKFLFSVNTNIIKAMVLLK